MAAHVRADDGEIYEHERLRKAMVERRLEVDARPDGKRIAFVRIVQEDVFVEDEVWPTWPNTFHWLTDEDVIRRELVLHAGDTYDDARVQESERNLRALGTLALVRIVAVRIPAPAGAASAGAPDEVGLLVYVRDLWSLRTETAFAGTGQAFGGSFQLVERNLFGRDKEVAARFGLAPDSFSVGQSYGDPRLLGARLSLAQSFDVILNRASGDTEGSRGSVGLGRPFYDLAQAWSWGVGASYAVFVARRLRDGQIVAYPVEDGRVLDAPVNGLCDPAGPNCVARAYRSRSAAAESSVTYRRGVRYKQSFTFGAGYFDGSAEPHRESGLDADEEPIFRAQVLPQIGRQVYPFVQYGLALPAYEVFQNLGTFGVSETVRVGPDAFARVRFPLSAFGSSSDAIAFAGSLGYTLADGHALGGASASAGARFDEGRVISQSLGGSLVGVTPTLLVGRMVASAGWTARRRAGTAEVVLGGDNGLRGYPSGEFGVSGGSVIQGTAEYRTLPLVIATVHLGAVLFYDVGSVYAALDRAAFHHGAGAGIRLLFPQVNRDPFRLDFGVPLDTGGFRVLLSYSSSQAI
jgi:hypothetical protein